MEACVMWRFCVCEPYAVDESVFSNKRTKSFSILWRSVGYCRMTEYRRMSAEFVDKRNAEYVLSLSLVFFGDVRIS